MSKLHYIPAVHRIQKEEAFLKIQQKYDLTESLVTKWVQEIIEFVRGEMMTEPKDFEHMNEAAVYAMILRKLSKRADEFARKNQLEKVINATGVVLHTNLGRSRLSKAALKQINETAQGYSTLEYDISTGERGSRHSIVEEYLKTVTGAEAAMVVNNNAAAVYLVLQALAKGKEVIVSRGELVEIGGSFRISEIMALSGAKLVEIGTTNKTKLRDYESAFNEDTGMVLKVHKSNFAIVGFTEEVEAKDLAKLVEEYEIPIYEDLGSGTLFDFSSVGIAKEPTVQEQVAKGIDIISFSGDKLLGGPQAGIIVGKEKYIQRLKQDQLARVLRVDKFTLASLEATLKAYIVGKEETDIPTVRDIIASAEDVKYKAVKFMEQVTNKSLPLIASLKKGVSKVGGGTMPNVNLPTYIVEVVHKNMSSHQFATLLREAETPIIVRVSKEAVLLDFRTVTDGELAIVIESFLQCK